MPDVSAPPGSCRASYMVTSCPRRIRSPATVIPAGPDPMMATFFPVAKASSGISIFSCRASHSAANLSRRPMATGAPFLCSRHSTSHCSSCGQTLPHTAGRQFFAFRILMAPLKSSSAIHFTNPGISISTGQPLTHSDFLQSRHLRAS